MRCYMYKGLIEVIPYCQVTTDLAMIVNQILNVTCTL